MKLGELTNRTVKAGWRTVFMIYFLVVFVRHLADPNYSSIIDALNLGIHEVGHLFFSFGTKLFSVLGGTVFQLMAPLYGMYNFYKRKESFCVALCFAWLSTNFFDIATYAADAKDMSLPLVSPFGFGGYITHDWNFILSRFNMVLYCGQVAFAFRIAAVLSMLVFFVYGSREIWKVLTVQEEE